MSDKALRALLASLPFELPSKEEVTFSSGARAQTRGVDQQWKWYRFHLLKRPGDDGSLMLAGERLIFVTEVADKCWEVRVSDIADLQRRLGTILEFDAARTHYALTFGQATGLVFGSNVVGKGLGGSIGAEVGLAGEALAAGTMVKGASLGKKWFSLLGGDARPAAPS